MRWLRAAGSRTPADPGLIRLNRDKRMEAEVSRTEMGQVCATCGTMLVAGARFCTGCGQSAHTDPTVAGVIGNRAHSRWWRRVAVTVLLVGVAVVGDWAWRVEEASAFVTHVEASEAAMQKFDQGLVSASGAAEAAHPSWKTIPLELQAAHADYVTAVASLAAYYEPTLIREHAAIEGLTFAPWHRSLARAREAYLNHNSAWIDHLGKVVKDGEAVTDKTPEISGTWLVVQDTLPGAIPPWAWGDLAARANQIVAD